MARIGAIKLGFGLLGDALTGRLIRDLRGESRIPLEEGMIGGLRYRFARDLMAQRTEPDGTIWASRGYLLYRRPPNGDAFLLEDRLPCPLTAAWMGRFARVRRYVHRYDLVDVFPLASGGHLAFSGGRVYRREAGERSWQEVQRLSRWGPGVGRGIRSQALVQTSAGTIFYGEYFHNPANDPVRLWASDDDGRRWRVAYEFPAGATRHVHSLQEDPFTGRLWVCTGDANDASIVGWLDPTAGRIAVVGTGSQRWRACKLIFTAEAVFWASDTNLPEERGVVRWDRTSGQNAFVCHTDGPSLSATRLAGGTWVVGTDREGLIGQQWFFASPKEYHVTEPDEYPSLWLSSDGVQWRRLKLWRWVPIGRWFGIPQIAVGDGSPELAMTCMHLEQHDGDLVLVTEPELRRWLKAPPEDDKGASR